MFFAKSLSSIQLSRMALTSSIQKLEGLLNPNLNNSEIILQITGWYLSNLFKLIRKQLSIQASGKRSVQMVLPDLVWKELFVPVLKNCGAQVIHKRAWPKGPLLSFSREEDWDKFWKVLNQDPLFVDSVVGQVRRTISFQQRDIKFFYKVKRLHAEFYVWGRRDFGLSSEE